MDGDNNNTSWLHLASGFASGAGGTNVIFTCDANPGALRIGTLTIAGQPLTVTQAALPLPEIGWNNLLTIISRRQHHK